MNLPSAVRRALGLKGAGHVVITMDDDGVTLRTMAQVLERVRALARPYAPKEGFASDALIAERREEARREEAFAAPTTHRGRRRPLG
jgi:bifunctional DNA-binding transcriptional regulator/antitoxin component of YhaV-PrlF toxin-antitoxin module